LRSQFLSASIFGVQETTFQSEAHYFVVRGIRPAVARCGTIMQQCQTDANEIHFAVVLAAEYMYKHRVQIERQTVYIANGAWISRTNILQDGEMTRAKDHPVKGMEPFTTYQTQNSPPPPPMAAAPHIPIKPHTPTRQPRHRPCTPCPLRVLTGLWKPIFWALAALEAVGPTVVIPSSRMTNQTVPSTPLYGPGSMMVWNLLRLLSSTGFLRTGSVYWLS
jgi:hypothetical protein